MARISKRQRRRFLQALEQTGNARASARLADTGRRTAYDWRTRDHDFAKAWDDALRRHSDKQMLKAYQLGLPGSTEAVLAMLQRAQDEARASLEACAEATLKVPG